MSVADYVAFFIPLVFVAVLWRAWAHFAKHRLALVSLLLLTLVSILHFDVGMLTTDPYDEFLDDIGAPNRTWAASVIVLILLSYSGDAWDRIMGEQRSDERVRATRGSRGQRRNLSDPS
ncbi:MAG TPA: hypothetical protein QGF05_02405 [Dehalococcoidia bacterium]|nr:hypothetical protein [Dehalococcoidia bacterium]